MGEFEITCKKCFGKKELQSETGGCPGCGGFGYIAKKQQCPTCDRWGYFRPLNGMTVYEGKRYYSIDGLEMVAHIDRFSNCVHCEEK